MDPYDTTQFSQSHSHSHKTQKAEKKGDILSEFKTKLGCYAFVELGATWCTPCKHVSKIFLDLAPKNSSVSFIQVDVEKDKEIFAWIRKQLPKGVKVPTIPQILAFKNGAFVELLTQRTSGEMNAVSQKVFGFALKVRSEKESKSERI